MKLTRFDLILNIWMALIISAILSIVLPVVMTGVCTWHDFWLGWIVSTILSFVITLVLPAAHWGDMFAEKCGAKPHTVPRQLLTTIVLGLIMSVFMCSFMVWFALVGIARLPGSVWEPIYLVSLRHAYPFALLTIYVSANIGLWSGIPLVKRILRIPAVTE